MGLVISFMPLSAIALAVLTFTLKRVSSGERPPPRTNRLDHLIFASLVSRIGPLLIISFVGVLIGLHVLWLLADMLFWQHHADDKSWTGPDRRLREWLGLGPVLIAGYGAYILWTIPRCRRRAKKLTASEGSA
jgi:hypothetical protein